MRYSPRLLTILTLIILLPPAVEAQDNETTEESTPRYRLPLIITSAFRESEAFFSPVEQITAQDLREQGITTVAGALDLLPGLRTGVTRVGHGAYVSLRGFEQQNLLIVVDETPLYMPYDGLLELDQLSVDQIQSIRVIKGSAPLHYGPNSLGGVIHIVTRNPTTAPSSDASVSISENRTYGVRLATGWHGGPWRLSLSGSRDRSDGFRLASDFQEADVPALPGGQESLHYENGGWRDNSDHAKETARLGGSYVPNDRFRVDLSVGLVNNRWGIPPHPIYNPDKDKSRVRYWRFTEWKQAQAGLTIAARLHERTWAQGALFYNTYDNVLDGYDDDTYRTQEKPYAFHSIYDDRTAGGRLRLDLLLARAGHVTMAAGLTEDVHRDTPDRGEPTDLYRHRTWWWSLEDQVAFSTGVSVNVGCSGSLLEKIHRADGLDPGKDLTALNPRISLAAVLSPSSRLYLTGAHLSRFPTMKQLYGTDGNPDLKAQRSDHLELGGEWTTAVWLQVRGSVFFDHIRDLIEGNYTSPALRNIPKASLTGGEMALLIDPFDGFHARLSYTYLWAQNRSPNRPGDDLQYRPKHQLDWRIRTKLPHDVRLYISGSAISRRYFYNDFYGGRRDHLASFASIDIILRRTFSFGLEPFVAVENLFDAPYSQVYTSPAPGRQVRGGMRVSW
jgi:iron complex outermembrane receptor protein